jgi:hypothetical protein
MKANVKPSGLALEWTLEGRGKRAVRGGGPGDAVTGAAACAQAGKLPRVTRLMALALKFQGMVDRREIRDYADIARLGRVTRARSTQLMNLLNLAPDIQEAILLHPSTTHGRDPISERGLRELTAVVPWGRQRKMWRERLSRQKGRSVGTTAGNPDSGGRS